MSWSRYRNVPLPWYPVNGLHGTTYEEKLDEPGMESLSQRRITADVTTMFKVQLL
jgi:hypothetical protein